MLITTQRSAIKIPRILKVFLKFTDTFSCSQFLLLGWLSHPFTVKKLKGEYCYKIYIYIIKINKSWWYVYIFQNHQPSLPLTQCLRIFVIQPNIFVFRKKLFGLVAAIIMLFCGQIFTGQTASVSREGAILFSHLHVKHLTPNTAQSAWFPLDILKMGREKWKHSITF